VRFPLLQASWTYSRSCSRRQICLCLPVPRSSAPNPLAAPLRNRFSHHRPLNLACRDLFNVQGGSKTTQSSLPLLEAVLPCRPTKIAPFLQTQLLFLDLGFLSHPGRVSLILFYPSFLSTVVTMPPMNVSSFLPCASRRDTTTISKVLRFNRYRPAPTSSPFSLRLSLLPPPANSAPPSLSSPQPSPSSPAAPDGCSPSPLRLLRRNSSLARGLRRCR
jgi:hypothetical protein